MGVPFFESIRRHPLRGLAAACTVLIAVAVAALLFAPYLYIEYMARAHGPIVGPRPATRIVGRWFDDYFVIERIDASTYAIGEPRYYQGNYSYLILGSERALLFDAGSGNRDIVAVVRSLTMLPVTVIPSHLHFDHVGAVGRFEHLALLDEPGLRGRVRDGKLVLRRYEFLGFADALAVPTVRVDEWWADGAQLELGGRTLSLLATPGHTPTSVSLYDRERRLLFCGDFVYPGTLYAFVPGASRAAYARTTGMLIGRLDPATILLTAHLPDDPRIIEAPRLAVADLRDLAATLRAIEAGSARGRGVFPRMYAVNASMSFATGLPVNTR